VATNDIYIYTCLKIFPRNVRKKSLSPLPQKRAIDFKRELGFTFVVCIHIASGVVNEFMGRGKDGSYCWLQNESSFLTHKMIIWK